MKKRPILILALFVLALAFAGCAGENGKDGGSGTRGSDGSVGNGFLEPGAANTDLGVARSELRSYEQCATCHGLGKEADVKKAHYDRMDYYRIIGAGPLNVQQLTAEDQAKIKYNIVINDVQFAGGTTTVAFTVTDQVTGAALTGMGLKTATYGTTSTSTRGRSLTGFNFSIAYLSTSTYPTKWVNYMVLSSSTSAYNVATTSFAGTGFTDTVKWGVYRPGTDNMGSLVDNGGGSYTYQFFWNAVAASNTASTMVDNNGYTKTDLGDLTFVNNLTHRAVLQYSGNIASTSPSVVIKYPVNAVYDFVPATGAVVTTDAQRNITHRDQCMECHNTLFIESPHGGRVDPAYCTVCHTSQRAFGRNHSASTNGAFALNGTTATSTYVADGEVVGEFVTMVHKIHKGSNIAGTSLTKTNYNYAGFYMETIKGYPMNPANCLKCHDVLKQAVAGTNANGDSWNQNPSIKACGACHDGIIPSSTGGFAGFSSTHTGGAITADTNAAACTTGGGCHPVANTKSIHGQVMSTTIPFGAGYGELTNYQTNNPATSTALAYFTYTISSASVNASNTVVIAFKIDKYLNGSSSPINFNVNSTSNPLSGFTGAPSFLLAYATSSANQTISTATDYNNAGQTAAQAISVSLGTLYASSSASAAGYMTLATSTGVYTANITLATKQFPVGATLKAVALQGYFTQLAVAEGTWEDLDKDGTKGEASVSVARHTLSVYKAIDTARRVVVDSAKCGSCHEWFEGHGGNRVYETKVCVMCHVPNLSTSGRTVTDAQLTAYNFNSSSSTQNALVALQSWWTDVVGATFSQSAAGASLNFPETTNNFKEMIHGIHAGGDRTEPFFNVRNRLPSELTIVDASGIVFPGALNNCESCHLASMNTASTFDADLPTGVLPTTNVTFNGTNSVAAITTARTTVPNATDLVIGPITGACISCHDSAATKAHINSNGGQLK